jgi:hypothetical protein
MVTIRFAACLIGISAAFYANAGIQSQHLPSVSNLPVALRIVSPCGEWKAKEAAGYYKMVVADVYGGAGSEIYLQKISTSMDGAKIESTIAFTELNDDHSQYYIETAQCKREGKAIVIRLKAIYEHDEPDEYRRITVRVNHSGKYEIDNEKYPAAKVNK